MSLPSARSTAGVFLIATLAAIAVTYFANRTTTGQKLIG